jgi:hypothetical protein
MMDSNDILNKQQQQQTTPTASSGGGGGSMISKLGPMTTAGGGGLNTMDTGGLTFGPAWLRQLSSGDSSKISALPPSPGLAFQLAKHRYGREEMLAIYETIEKTLFNVPAPTTLVNDFEDLCKRDLQKPISLTALTLDQQVGEICQKELII